MNFCRLSSTAKSHAKSASDPAASPFLAFSMSSRLGAVPMSALQTGAVMGDSAIPAARSYAPSAMKCRNQSTIGPGPAWIRICGTNIGSRVVIVTSVLPRDPNFTTSCRNGRMTSSPSEDITPKFIRISLLMKPSGGDVPGETDMHFWKSQDAESAG